MSEDAKPTPRRLLRAEQVLAARSRRVCVVLEGSQDPHNVHAVMRTAEALGLQDLHLVAPRGEAGTISAGVTQRAHEWLTVRRHRDIDACVEFLRAEGRTIHATANEPGARATADFAPDGRIAILFGNETEGLSARARELADGLLRIDLVGFSGSLNLSVSAAIVLWELRRLAVTGDDAGDLAPAEIAELRETWYRRLLGRRVRSPEALSRWVAKGAEIAAESGRRRIPAAERPEA
jgi:tRNA (guanosine-2'-O-)-methyltransferase